MPPRRIDNSRDAGRVWEERHLEPAIMTQPEHVDSSMTSAQHAGTNHTGIPGVGTGPSSVSVTVSSAEILALFTTFKQLIAAPGAGKYIIVETIVVLNDFGTVAYVTSGDLGIRYTDDSGGRLGGLKISFVQAVADVVAQIIPNLDGGTDFWPSLRPRLAEENAPLVLSANEWEFADNPTTGDGELKLEIIYRIITFP